MAESTHSQLQELSGMYGVQEWDGNGYLISNDKGVKKVFPDAINALRTEGNKGIGLFVGQGGVFSMLPDLTVDIPLVVDINPAVSDFAQVMAKVIIQTENPKQAIDCVFDKVSLAASTNKPYGFPDLLAEQLRDEGLAYEDLHWTNRRRFPQVQQALVEKPLLSIAADVSSAGFIEGFKRVLRASSQPLSFVNLTNLVEYRELHYDLGSEFLDEYPIDESTIVLYASHKERKFAQNMPGFYIAEGRKELMGGLNYLKKQPWL